MASNLSTRSQPNILITGTPGTGKSVLATALAEQSGINRIDINEVAKQNNLYESFDENYSSYVLDEEKILDAIEDQMDQGGNVVDYHGSDFFPERWFDAVFVLRTDNTTLYDRLMARGYMGRKLTENIECEIFGTLAEEARDAYPSLNVQELNSKTMDDFNANLDLLTAFVNEFRAAKQQK